MTEQESNIVILTRCYDITEAHIIRGLVESHDIPCYLMDEHHNAMAWHLSIGLGGVRVMVHEDDFEQAKALISNDQPQAQKECGFLKKPYLQNVIMAIIGIFYMVPIKWPSKRTESEKDEHS